MGRVGQADAFELDDGPAGVVGQPDTVAEHDGSDAYEALVEHSRVEALPTDAGAEDVDVLVAGRGAPLPRSRTKVMPGVGVRRHR